jgi:hypothetical protein
VDADKAFSVLGSATRLVDRAEVMENKAHDRWYMRLVIANDIRNAKQF